MVKSEKKGFTFMEVLIAMALFALLMTIVTSAVIQCMRSYRKSAGMSLLRKKASLVLSVLSADIAKANAIYSPLYPSTLSSDYRHRLQIWFHYSPLIE